MADTTKDLILTYEDAWDAIADGVHDWKELTARLPRNDLPAVLVEIAWGLDTCFWCVVVMMFSYLLVTASV